MKNIKNYSLPLLLALSALSITVTTGTSCARKRAVEKKVDLDGNRFEKAIFDDGRTWLGRVTVVNNGSNSAFGFIGAQNDAVMGKFRFTKDALQFVADNGQVKTGEQKVLNEWTITHSQYHRHTSGGKVSNVETENDLIPWNEKKYFKADFENPSVTEGTTFPYGIDERCWSRAASRVVPDSLEASPEVINFIIEVDYRVADASCLSTRDSYHLEHAHTMQYMYSFMPDRPSDYKPYVYAGENDPLTKKYGYFITSNSFRNADGRPESTFLMNRWALGKTHTFYFADDFPAEYKWVYNDPERGVIARTNKLLADNGIDLRFEVKDAGKEHKFGDIRYSFFKWIAHDDEQAPLGYGPSTNHPLTGEILSANSTMWTASLKFHIKRMKDEKKASAMRDETSPVYKQMNTLLESPSKDWTKTAAFLEKPDHAALFRYLLPDFTYGNQGNMYAEKVAEVDAPFGNAKLAAYWSQAGKKSNELEALKQKVEQGRKEYFKKEASELKSIQRHSTVWYLNEAMITNIDESFEGKSEAEIMNDVLYRTAIHEFGHNLNLRHNFYGSVDAATRKDKVAAGKKYTTTSVMDYLDFAGEIGLEHDWEDYDRAAILYAYSDGKIDKIQESGDPYLFCTDEHTYSNPLCNRFDRGATASEIVANMIQTYEDDYAVRNFRYGREFWQTGGYVYQIFGTMYKLKKFLTFSNQAFSLGEIKKNLTHRTDLDPKLPTEFGQAMEADMQQAVRLVTAFYASVIKTPATERPFQDSYDSVSGALSRHGIQLDKYFALEMLLGDHGVSVNPNQGHLVTSFFNLLGDESMKDFVQEIIEDVYLDSGDMYVGYDEMGRDLFVANASSLLNRELAPTESTRITCMTETTLATTFGLDLKKTDYDTGRAIQIPVPAESTGYFKNEGIVLAIYLDGHYYVSGIEKNRLGALLINKADARPILSAYRSYSFLTTGGPVECR